MWQLSDGARSRHGRVGELGVAGDQGPHSGAGGAAEVGIRGLLHDEGRRGGPQGCRGEEGLGGLKGRGGNLTSHRTIMEGLRGHGTTRGAASWERGVGLGKF